MTPEESYKAVGLPEFEKNTELEQKALEGWAEVQHENTLLGDYANLNIEVGPRGRPVALHWLLRTVDGLLRREQYSPQSVRTRSSAGAN